MPPTAESSPRVNPASPPVGPTDSISSPQSERLPGTRESGMLLQIVFLGGGGPNMCVCYDVFSRLSTNRSAAVIPLLF